jgi:hypothetical protein
MLRFRQFDDWGLQRMPVSACSGKFVVQAMILVALAAIAIGLFWPDFQSKRKSLTAWEQVGPGRIKGNLCTNDFFGFSIEVPKGWRPLPREELRRRLESESDFDRKNVSLILAAFKVPRRGSQAEPLHSALIVGAERLTSVFGAGTARDYVRRIVRKREREQSAWGTPRGPYKCVIGGQEFLRLDCDNYVRGRTGNTSLVVIAKKNYVLAIGTGWENEDDRKTLERAIKTARFK